MIHFQPQRTTMPTRKKSRGRYYLMPDALARGDLERMALNPACRSITLLDAYEANTSGLLDPRAQAVSIGACVKTTDRDTDQACVPEPGGTVDGIVIRQIYAARQAVPGALG